jgi:hypothetical protein
MPALAAGALALSPSATANPSPPLRRAVLAEVTVLAPLVRSMRMGGLLWRAAARALVGAVGPARPVGGSAGEKISGHC